MADITVEFGSSQSIGALREAAYRLIGEASCLIDTVDARHVCRLTPKKALAGEADEALRARFLDLVTDENLREKVAAETAGVRDVILALAFGALAREREDSKMKVKNDYGGLSRGRCVRTDDRAAIATPPVRAPAGRPIFRE